MVPVLLFGCENWMLTDSMLHQLESFQGEIGRRILKLSKYHSTLSTHLALRWPSVTARMFVRKLSLRCLTREIALGAKYFQAHHKILSGMYSYGG